MIPTGQSSQLTEKTLESLTLGVRESTVFRSALEFELDKEIEFTGSERPACDRAGEEVPQEGGTLERFLGGFAGVYLLEILGTRCVQRGPGFPGGPLEGSAPHLPGNGEADVGIARQKMLRSEIFKECTQGLLRGVFPGESGVAFSHPADGRMQHGEKQEYEDTVYHASGEKGFGVEEVAEKPVGRRVSIQSLQVRKEFVGGLEDRETWSRAEKVMVTLLVDGVGKLRAEFFLDKAKEATTVRPVAHDRSPGIREYSDRAGDRLCRMGVAVVRGTASRGCIS